MRADGSFASSKDEITGFDRFIAAFYGIQRVGDCYCFSRHTFIFKYVDHMLLSSVLIRASVTY